MADNDFQTKLNRGKEFLTEGNKIRISVKFVGRQLSHKEFGGIMMDKAFAQLSELASFDQPAKWIGRQYVATLTPVKKK
jgi:translation initiation factor IF-3